MAFQSPLFSNSTVCPFRLKQIVSINEMINILKSHLSFYWPYENSFQKIVILPELLFSEVSCLYLFVFQKVNRTQLILNVLCGTYSRMLFLSSQLLFWDRLFHLGLSATSAMNIYIMSLVHYYQSLIFTSSLSMCWIWDYRSWFTQTFYLALILKMRLPLSPPQRPLCAVRRVGRKKKKGAGHDGKRKGRGARWEKERKKRSLFPPFPSSHRPPRACYISIRDTQRPSGSLWGEVSDYHNYPNWWCVIHFIPLLQLHSYVN